MNFSSVYYTTSLSGAYQVDFAIVSLLFLSNAIGFFLGGVTNMKIADKIGFGRTSLLGELILTLIDDDIQRTYLYRSINPSRRICYSGVGSPVPTFCDWLCDCWLGPRCGRKFSSHIDASSSRLCRTRKAICMLPQCKAAVPLWVFFTPLMVRHIPH